jgi:nucleoside-diphosphate-sugar epimerase
VIPTIITQALTQSSVKLGNLSTTRDFNYVSDTVEGFIAIAENPSTVGKTLNIGSGTETSVREIAELIFDLAGKTPAIEIEEKRLRPEASEVDRLCASSELLTHLAGWKPEVPLREGLRRTIEWIGQNLQSYSTGNYVI